MVIATQNPIEQEGTYPLPEAQMDRFFMKIHIDYPDEETELAILQQAQQAPETGGTDAQQSPVMSAEALAEAQHQCQGVYLDDMLARYIVALVTTTRQAAQRDAQLGEWLSRGASPRATLALARAARARAYLQGRDFATPDDIMALAGDVLNHRISLGFAARAAGIGPRQAVARLLETVPAP